MDPGQDELWTQGDPRRDLLRVVTGLSDGDVAQLLELASALAEPIEEVLLPGSELATPRFAAEFRARLKAHHAAHASPMSRLSFESALFAAVRADRRTLVEAPSATTRFYDVTIDGKQVALKFEGAKAMRADALLISKLSEASWVQDVRGARMRREHTLVFLEQFLSAVDRIIVLRHYRNDTVPHYELVEIPVRHFALLRDVPLDQFDSDGPKIQLADDQGPILKFCLDRSDSKITIRNIVKHRCIVHADWRLVGSRGS